jgi:hypothetical protein
MMAAQVSGQTRIGIAKRCAFLPIAFIVYFLAFGIGTEVAAQEMTKIRIRMGDKAVTATLNSSEAARDLAAMLPLQIRMRDHMAREKTGPIPKQLSELTNGSLTYEVGDLGYWRPGNNFVIFYKHDGLQIPSPGIVKLGTIQSGAEVFDVPGSVDVLVERSD